VKASDGLSCGSFEPDVFKDVCDAVVGVVFVFASRVDPELDGDEWGCVEFLGGDGHAVWEC